MTTNKDDNITIYEILNKVQSNDMVVPALQRSFVWKKNQIIDLFDSIYREYPIGNFVESGNAHISTIQDKTRTL